MKKRIRRSAADARQQILDAAEHRMVESGPGGIRLQEIAADVGISHPTILHHFAGRDALVAEVVNRVILGLEEEMLKIIDETGVMTSNSTLLFDRVFERLFDRGHARLIAWLLLGGIDPLDSDAARTRWARVTRTSHDLRKSAAQEPPGFEDTRFTIVLSALALFGEAIAGRAVLRLAGVEPTPRNEERFRTWFAALIGEHLKGGGTPVLPRAGGKRRPRKSGAANKT